LDESAQPTQVSENDSLFYIYTSITSIWYDIGENEEAKKSFQKAQNIANTETDITRKIKKLFTLVSLLIEKQSD
jgi:hypothetical protein